MNESLRPIQNHYSSEEDFIHLFWQCSYIEQFWSDFLVFIESHFVIDFSFCFKDAFLDYFTIQKNAGKYYKINLFSVS